MQFSHATPLYRHLRGEDQILQENKVANLRLAAARLDGIVLRPGETFSYWRLIGKPTRRKGYKEGMVLFWAGSAAMWAVASASCPISSSG